MQTIRIIISFRNAPKRKSRKSIPVLLRAMPKALLAKALNIPYEEESPDV